MKRNGRKEILREALSYVWAFLMFFGLIAFVITCSFLVFGAAVDLPEAEVRAFAPLVFFNALILTVFFVAVDLVRRKVTVDRPVREIRRTLRRLTEGDFGARVSMKHLGVRESRFREIAESINRLAEELAGVETLRTDFIANVSHELKTPLAVMQNYAVILQQRGLPREEQEEYARVIAESSRRLSGLITNILKLNRLENQQIYPAVAEFDLSEQICGCLLQFEDLWEKKTIGIETNIDEGIRISSDAELLSLVWNNLFSNAIKFTEPGGTVSVGLHTEGDWIAVRVSDTGCGMSPEVGAHIFEKF
ncbi:MAG: HAMP domain-containing histidine kinase [Butyricicoccus sp.]|nr:HAMP domain-containing histidine kinase [Butyricicoccus sp.]